LAKRINLKKISGLLKGDFTGFPFGFIWFDLSFFSMPRARFRGPGESILQVPAHRLKVH